MDLIRQCNNSKCKLYEQNIQPVADYKDRYAYAAIICNLVKKQGYNVEVFGVEEKTIITSRIVWFINR